MRRLLEAQASVSGSASGEEVVFSVAAADAEGMIGKLGSFEPYALRLIGDSGGDITIKKIVARPAVHEQGQYVVLKSTNGWKVADLNALCGPDTDGLDLPRYSVADGYELRFTCDNANAGAVALTLAMKVENQTSTGVIGANAAPGFQSTLPPGFSGRFGAMNAIAANHPGVQFSPVNSALGTVAAFAPTNLRVQ